MSKPFNRNNWVKAKLRQFSLRYPSREEAVRAARIERGQYRCAMCEGSFKRQEVQVDHIEPVVPLNNQLEYMEIDWNQYIPRLFCEADKLQIVCIECHLAKSHMEDAMRKKFNDAKRLQKREREKEKRLDKQKKKE